jgi:hypothetical protein
MLDTNTAIEANAATSRRISVISVSLSLYVFILFFSCSNVNPKKPSAPMEQNPPRRNGIQKRGKRSDLEFDDVAVHQGDASIHAPGDLVIVGRDHRRET